MAIAWLIPVILSAVLLGAHFLRAGLTPLALVIVLFPAVLLLRRAWVARLTQVVLALGAIEWVRTTLGLVAERRELGQSWSRLAVILGLVAAFTFGSALPISLSSALRKRYRLK
jgi:hypothetical protein